MELSAIEGAEAVREGIRETREGVCEAWKSLGGINGIRSWS